MTTKTLEKAKELASKILAIESIIKYLKDREPKAPCRLIIKNCTYGGENSLSLTKFKIVDKMCDLLINEYTQELNKFQKELDNL